MREVNRKKITSSFFKPEKILQEENSQFLLDSLSANLDALEDLQSRVAFVNRDVEKVIRRSTRKRK